MAAVSIRGLDEGVRERLRVRAAAHGRSMEAEMRVILTAAVADEPERVGLAHALLAQFGSNGGVELDLPARLERPRAADLGW